MKHLKMFFFKVLLIVIQGACDQYLSSVREKFIKTNSKVV